MTISTLFLGLLGILFSCVMLGLGTSLVVSVHNFHNWFSYHKVYSKIEDYDVYTSNFDTYFPKDITEGKDIIIEGPDITYLANDGDMFINGSYIPYPTGLLDPYTAFWYLRIRKKLKEKSDFCGIITEPKNKINLGLLKKRTDYIIFHEDIVCATDYKRKRRALEIIVDKIDSAKF